MDSWEDQGVNVKTEDEPGFSDIKTSRMQNRYAFCECRNHHLVGYVEDQKFYFTDISPLKMMFP